MLAIGTVAGVGIHTAGRTNAFGFFNPEVSITTSGDVPKSWVDVAREYVDEYGCSEQFIAIARVAFEANDSEERHDLSISGKTVAPGSVLIDQRIDIDDAEKTVRHEISHACSSDFKLADRIYTHNGVYIFASRGFRLIAKDQSGEYAAYDASIEESVSEWIACMECDNNRILPAGYEHYERGRQLVDRLVSESGLTAEEVISFKNNSDVWGFIAGLYSLESAKDMTPEQFDTMVTLFRSVFYS